MAEPEDLVFNVNLGAGNATEIPPVKTRILRTQDNHATETARLLFLITKFREQISEKLEGTSASRSRPASAATSC